MITEKLNSYFISFLLIGTLLFPSAVQVVHDLEGHEHTVCSDFSTHVHENKTDCDLCHFHSSPFEYQFDTSSGVIKISTERQIECFYTFISSKYSSPNNPLRGPPVLS
jgi:hypothetical protein